MLESALREFIYPHGAHALELGKVIFGGEMMFSVRATKGQKVEQCKTYFLFLCDLEIEVVTKLKVCAVVYLQRSNFF